VVAVSRQKHLRGLAIGIAIAVAAGVIVTAVASRECEAGEECLAVLSGLGFGVTAGGIAAALAILVLASRVWAGPIFGIGSAAALLILVRAAWGLGLGQSPLLLFAAAVVFAGAAVVSRSYQPVPAQAAGSSRRQWSRPTLATVLVAVGVVVLAGLPAGAKLKTVWSQQRKIEAVVERPLQTDLDGTWPTSVRYSATGIDYSVLERPSDGARIADIDVTTRTLSPGQASCTGFDDKTEGAVTQCTAIGPDLLRGRGSSGESRYFVRAGNQWAYVSAGTYGGGNAQRIHDARAEQIARSLEPRSAWALAAGSADCGFCEWLT
jgi:hypothetical protein